jgi:hypothetical protein
MQPRHPCVAADSPATLLARWVWRVVSERARRSALVLSFGAMAAATAGIRQLIELGPADRLLSYLPLAHTLERWIAGCASTQASSIRASSNAVSAALVERSDTHGSY